MKSGRYTQTENDALRAIRNANSSVPQRTLAEDIFFGRTYRIGGNDLLLRSLNVLYGRTQASIYSALRRIDRQMTRELASV